MNQVHMGPFGLIFMQPGSHGLREAPGMPPGPKAAKLFFCSSPLGPRALAHPIFALFGVAVQRGSAAQLTLAAQRKQISMDYIIT